jgi:hypothetical protein
MPFTPTSVSTVKKLCIDDLVFSTYNENNGSGGGVYRVVKILDRTVRGNIHPSLVAIQLVRNAKFLQEAGHHSFDLDETHLVKVDEASVMERMQKCADMIRRLDEVLNESKAEKTQETTPKRKKKAVQKQPRVLPASGI